VKSGNSYNDIMATDEQFRDTEISLVNPSPLDVVGTTGFTFDFIGRGINRTWFAVLQSETTCWVERRQIRKYRVMDTVISKCLWEGKVRVPSFVYTRLETEIRLLFDSAKGVNFGEFEMVNGDWYVFNSRWYECEQPHRLALYVPSRDDNRTARRIISRIDKLVRKKKLFFSILSVPVLGRLAWCLS